VTEPTLQAVFGAGATQTATTITILKADLQLTATATNRADQLFAGIVKRAASELTDVKFDADPDRSIEIVPGFDSIIYRTVGTSQIAFLQNPLTINFAKTQSSTGLNPDDY
jgi:hypothetical protein